MHARTRSKGASLALLLTVCAASPAVAQSGGVYDLTWNKVAEGGITTASGGPYTLGGTIGQADAGTASGATYQLDGGFWLGVAVGQLAAVPGPAAPPHATLSLRGLTSNPASPDRLEAAFSLADGEPATLELLDVAGRRLASAEVGGLGPGAHVFKLSPPQGMMPGIYWLRLRQSGQARVAKAVVLH